MGSEMCIRDRYYYDPIVRQPYGSANSYWIEAGQSANGLVKLPGTINVAIDSNRVIGNGTFFSANLNIGTIVKLQSANAANSFYTTVSSIISNTEFYTEDVVLKQFTAQTIFVPNLRINYNNDTIAAKIRVSSGNIASLDTQYLTSAVAEEQTVALTSDSQSFIYYANNTLVGPNSLTVAVNRQALTQSTFWSVANSTNHNIGNTVLTNKTNVTAELTAANYATINNNNIVKITANVGSFSNTIAIIKVIQGARAGETLFDSFNNSLNDQEIKNQLITVNSTGYLQNTGSAAQVENNKITVNSTGYLQNTGSATQVENARITINADGYLQNTGSNFDVYNLSLIHI